MDDVISIRDLTKTYSNAEKIVVFEEANLTVKRGEYLGIFAPSGYGKSTLINLIAGLDRPDLGEIWVDGRRVDTMSESELAVFRRRHIGIVFQTFNLFPTLTALENVMLPWSY